MAERREWWQIQVLVSAEKAYWTTLVDNMVGLKWTTEDLAEAERLVRGMLAQGRTVRLVRCTEEVVPVEG